MRTSFFLFVLALVACERLVKTGQEPPPVSPYIDASDYCESIADFFCDFYLRCGRMAVPDIATCKDVFAESCNSRYEPLYRGLESAGLVRLSRAGVATCKAHLRDVACEAQITELNGPCAALWEGQVQEGGACGFDIETFACAPGTTCRLGLDVCGTCDRLLAPGDACGEDVVGTCGSDGYCEDGVCVARIPIGGACTPDVRCQLGAGCVDGLCRGPVYVAVGEVCDYARRCPYLSECEAGVCVLARRQGESCADGAPCENGYCNAQGVCEPLLPPGAACAVDAQCAQSRCDHFTGACAAVPGICLAP